MRTAVKNLLNYLVKLKDNLKNTVIVEKLVQTIHRIERLVKINIFIMVFHSRIVQADLVIILI